MYLCVLVPGSVLAVVTILASLSLVKQLVGSHRDQVQQFLPEDHQGVLPDNHPVLPLEVGQSFYLGMPVLLPS